ncbi:MAG: DUF3179 domain-containing (seleno)protein [Solirubrobacteraceae bacterium]
MVAAAVALAGCGGANAGRGTPEPAGGVPAEPVVDPGGVPIVDRSRHSVPLGEVVFDTFDGRFVPLESASEARVRAVRDAIRPVYRPRHGSARALPWLGDDDLVIGVAGAGGAYAYPVKVLNVREIVNDVIAGRPIVVTYCPLCGSGVVYSRALAGRTLAFGNTSALYESDLVMYDHQTGSYWFQVVGQAIVGRLTGERLEPLPSATMPWARWRRLHPDTRLLAGDGDDRFDDRYAEDAFAAYPASVDRGEFAFPVSKPKLDRRLRAAEVVVAVAAGGDSRAYPVERIGTAAVNDELSGVPVVVFVRRGADAPFRASARGRRLTFELRDGRFVDRQTRTTWDLAGRAVAGPLQGVTLEPLPSRRAFWFSIAIAEPGIGIHASRGRSRGRASLP